MKILFDHQIFSVQTYGGISRYFAELYKGMNKTDGIEVDGCIKYSNNHYLKELGYDMNSSIDFMFDKVRLRGRGTVKRYANMFNSVSAIKMKNFDLLHPTYYDPYFLQYIEHTPFVMTVFDMIHEILPQYFSPKDSITEEKKLTLERAAKIIAISECTKRDLVNIFQIKEEKIDVIYLSNSLKKSIDLLDRPINLPERYVLFVGSRGGYKNFNTLLVAISDLLKEDETLYLICFGGGNFSSEEMNHFQQYNIANKIININDSDEILAYTYEHALAFVFPSLYEGFGIPVLEAMGCDCPALISNNSSLVEVGGDAAEYFDPNSADEMCASIKKVIYDVHLRQELICKGRVQSNKFSWDETVDKTLDVYRSII